MRQQRYTLENKTWYLVPPQGGQWVMDGNQRRIFSGEVVIDANGYLTDTEGNFLFSEETNGYVTATETQLTPVFDAVPQSVEQPIEHEPVKAAEPKVSKPQPVELKAPAPAETTVAPPNTDPTFTETAVASPVLASTVTETTVTPKVNAPTATASIYATATHAPQATQEPTQQYTPTMGTLVPDTTTVPATQEEKVKKGLSLPLSIMVILLAAGVGVGAGWLIFHFLG